MSQSTPVIALFGIRFLPRFEAATLLIHRPRTLNKDESLRLATRAKLLGRARVRRDESEAWRGRDGDPSRGLRRE